MYKVAVLLSTYNGSKYIKEQIDSILSQEGVNIDIYIRDDGSTDETVNIIYEYKSNNIFLTEGKNIGVGNSFMELLYSVPEIYDYYAFADQDDIWSEKKIRIAIEVLQKNKKHLYASNQELIDKSGKSLGLRYEKNKIIHLNPIAILEQNQIAGCTMVFDGFLKRQLDLNQPSKELLANRIHDVWVAMVASLFDSIIYDERAFIKYRQHDDNVVGAYAYGMKYDIKSKIMKIRNREQRSGRSLLAKMVYKYWPEIVCQDRVLFAAANANKMKNKCALIANVQKLRFYSKESTGGLILKILFGFF